MHLRGFHSILSVLILSLLGSTGNHSFAAAIFDRDVAPLLIRHCLECHNGFDLKGKLDLSQRDAALKGGKHGAVFVAGKPSESLLWEKVAEDDMPPDKPLGQAEKTLLRDWIAAGANVGPNHELHQSLYTPPSRLLFCYLSTPSPNEHVSTDAQRGEHRT